MADVIVQVSLVLLWLAGGCAVYRLIRGPHLVDRVVAVEKAAMMWVGFVLLDASITGERTYLDAAMALAMFSFVLTVFVASYLTGRPRDA